MILEIQGKRVQVDDSFKDLSPEEQQAQVDMIANQIMAGEMEGQKPSAESGDYDMTNPIAGAAIGTTLGAISGPAVGSAVDVAAEKIAGKALPKEDAKRRAISNWLKTQTTGPDVGGATYEDAFKKSQVARGVPVQSRGSEIPIRKGYLGVQNQPPEPSLSQKAAANIMEGERLGKPGVPRRIGGMGIAGAEAGKMVSDIEQGNTFDAIVSGLGTAGGAMSQSRIKPIRALGTGLSLLVPAFQGGKELKEMIYPSAPKEEEKEKKAAGGLVHLAKGKLVKKLSEVLVPHEGKTLLGTMADRTKATEGFSGGPGFINLHPEYTWAVDAPGAASRHMNIIQAAGGPERTVVAPMLMSTSAHRSNRPVFEKMYGELLEDIKSGKVTPEQVAALNKRIAVEKSLSGAPDITSKQFLDYANAFHRRGTIADIMGQKRIGAVDLKRQLDETIDPSLKEAKLGAIGPQLFTMESHMLKPDVHPGYKYVFTGEKGADQFTPVPREFLFRDLEAKAMKELGRPLSDYNYRTSVGVPTQQIDEQLIRSLEDLGYKEGGSTTPAWQRKEGKSPSGGLNAIGRASYKRETGGELKAPQPEGGSRKKSFCARMGGMKKKLTSSKTANDPDSRINKALRKWKC